MKLRQLSEARALGDKRIVHYYEYYPHYMGTLRNTGKIPLNKIDDVAHLVARGERETWERDLLGFKQYAFFDIIHNWSTIRPKLLQKGHWVNDWEEGSHSLSLNSDQEAYDILKKHELEQHDEEDWNMDDWE